MRQKAERAARKSGSGDSEVDSGRHTSGVQRDG